MFGGISNEGKGIATRTKRNQSTATSLRDFGLGYQTGMPEKASNERSEVNSYLYSIYFSKKIGPKIKEAIHYFSEHPDELSETGKVIFEKVKEDYELEYKSTRRTDDGINSGNF